MGVGCYRTRNHQSLRAIAEEGATVQSWLTGKTRGNDCVTYSPRWRQRAVVDSWRQGVSRLKLEDTSPIISPSG